MGKRRKPKTTSVSTVKTSNQVSVNEEVKATTDCK